MQFWSYILKADQFKLVQKIRRKQLELLISPFFSPIILSVEVKLRGFGFCSPAKKGRA